MKRGVSKQQFFLGLCVKALDAEEKQTEGVSSRMATLYREEVEWLGQILAKMMRKASANLGWEVGAESVKPS
jgi:hypothetical protein